MDYQERKFDLPLGDGDLPALPGLSGESVQAHLGLYAGYVKNFNAQTALIAEMLEQSAKYAHAISELMRRRAFEFGGMRLHELYFAQWERGPAPLATGSALYDALTRQFGSVDAAVTHVKQCGMMRGPGWSLLYFDKQAGLFHVGFSGEQHQGHFATLPVILALDVWEHAYLRDYGVTGKDKYIDAFFTNLNWNVCDERFVVAAR